MYPVIRRRVLLTDDYPESRHECCNVWVGTMVCHRPIRYESRQACRAKPTFTGLKEIDEPFTLIGSVWKCRNFRCKSI